MVFWACLVCRCCVSSVCISMHMSLNISVLFSCASSRNPMDVRNFVLSGREEDLRKTLGKRSHPHRYVEQDCGLFS